MHTAILAAEMNENRARCAWGFTVNNVAGLKSRIRINIEPLEMKSGKYRMQPMQWYETGA